MTTAHQSNVTENFENLTSGFGKKKDISEEIISYEKRVDSYMKKKQSLLRECSIS